MELHKASGQWVSRPDDERYLSLPDMYDFFVNQRDQSKQQIVKSSALDVREVGENQLSFNVEGVPFTPTHWSFNQVSTFAEAPPSYLRKLPAYLAAQNLNYGLEHKPVEDIQVLLQREVGTYGYDTNNVFRSQNGPKYGRIWNTDVTRELIARYGNGVDGDFRVPGIFGRALTEVTKENTTLFAGDRDMFVFLADEENKIEVPNRRGGEPGLLSRGFFIGNSEVGSRIFFIGTFLFDYVCANRIVWGAREYKEIKIRHTVTAPTRFLEEIKRFLDAFKPDASASALIGQTIADARSNVIDVPRLDSMLTARFGKRMVPVLKQIHMVEENRPIETLWDVTVAVTAYARDIKHQNERVMFELEAGDILKLAA